MSVVLIVADPNSSTRRISNSLPDHLPDCRIIDAPVVGEAISRAESRPPDLIVLDSECINCPPSDCCLRIKAAFDSEGSAPPPIVVIGGPRDDNACAGVLESGAAVCLYPPVSERLLAAQVQALLTPGSAPVEKTLKAREREITRSRKVIGAQKRLIWEILEASPNMVFAKDTGGRYAIGNRKVSEFYGIPLDDILGKTNVELAPDSQAAEEIHREDMAILGGERARVEREEEVVDARGRIFWFQTVKAPLYDREGRINGLVGIRMDITRMKRQEKEKLELEARLRHAQKLESLGTLAGAIAHDFNNILFPIMGYTEMLVQRTEEGSDERRMVEEILNAALRAQELIGQILSLSRRGEEKRQAVEMRLLAKEAVKFVKATLPASIRIRLPMLRSDGRAEQEVEPAGGAWKSGQGEKVLLVEDDPAVLEMLQEALEELGYRVEAFAAGGEALASFSNRPDEFRLVISDLDMPGMSGEDLAGRISAVSELVDGRGTES